jgi:hypothetical protein
MEKNIAVGQKFQRFTLATCLINIFVQIYHYRKWYLLQSFDYVLLNTPFQNLALI